VFSPPLKNSFARLVPDFECDFWLRWIGAARALLAGLTLVLCGPSCAQIFSNSPGGETGVILSNFPSSQTPVMLIDNPSATSALSPPAVRVSAASTLRLPAVSAEMNRLIADVSVQVQINPQLLHAVIAAESSYNPRALSARGAIGLMQLMPATAARFGARDPYVAEQNVLAGASYLKWLMAQFADDLELVLAAYNAGENAVIKAGRRIPPYPETQAYVPRVLAYLRCASNALCKPA
jgi:soluble lytic murein transglycosylase-like protein